VFDAVIQERNVTRAGQRLGLSQPAMSHALSRLSHMLKDDLFIRLPKGMFLPAVRILVSSDMVSVLTTVEFVTKGARFSDG
jgi:DNA-binding transcriptional LysR family regulator